MLLNCWSEVLNESVCFGEDATGIRIWSRRSGNGRARLLKSNRAADAIPFTRRERERETFPLSFVSDLFRDRRSSQVPIERASQKTTWTTDGQIYSNVWKATPLLFHSSPHFLSLSSFSLSDIRNASKLSMAGRTVAAAVIIRHRPSFEQIPSFFFLISLISWKRPKNRDVTIKMKLQIQKPT